MRDFKKLKAYYALAKPGIIYGNLLSVIGGFMYGSILQIHGGPFIGVVLGSSLVMASGCVINNYLDRGIDKHMKRTKKRALVTGQISAMGALLYAAVLALAGFGSLLMFTNNLTALLGLIGLISYAGIYTYAKPRTVHATLIGTLPGAIPALAGYTAATNRFDISAWILLAIMVCWQMAHFYAIATFRLKEYQAAKIPVMPAMYGVWATKLQMIVFSAGFLLAIIALAQYGYAGLVYLAIMVPVSVWWLLIITSGLKVDDSAAWARKSFGVSLIVLLAFSLALALNAWTP
jgi:protoheme IX farnesyltransferase